MEADKSSSIRFHYGQKDGIEGQIEKGNIDGSDIVITSDTDEIVFVDKTKAVKPIQSRTKVQHTLNGTALGALADGSVIGEGISLDEFIAMICEKEVPATYTAPKATIAVNGSAAGTYESGTNLKFSLTGAFVQNDAGELVKIALKQDGTEFLSQATSPISSDTIDYQVEDGAHTFSTSATYDEGAVKDNNLGNPSPDGHIAAGTVSSSNLTYTGKRRTFYGTGAGEVPEITGELVRGLSNSTLGASNGTSFNISVAVGQQYVAFAYPATLRDVNQVMYVEVNDSSMAANFTKSTCDVEGANGYDAVSYKVYTYQMSAPAQATMTFKVTI